MSRDPSKVYLSLVREGNLIRVVDQDGREVGGLKRASLSVGYDEAAELSLTVNDAPIDSDSKAHMGNRK